MSTEIGSGDTTRFWNKVIKQRTARWLHGIIGGFVTGAVTTAGSAGGLAIGQGLGIPGVSTLTVQQFVSVFISGGICGALAYLKKSPIPSIERKIVEGDPTAFVEKAKKVTEEDTGFTKKPTE